MKNYVLKSIFSVIMALGLLNCATLKDTRHTQFNNIYSTPMNREQLSDLQYFVDQQVNELEVELQKNLADRVVDINVELSQVMILDTGDFGCMSLQVHMNKDAICAVTVSMVKTNLGWVVTSVKVHDIMENLKKYIESLPVKTK